MEQVEKAKQEFLMVQYKGIVEKVLFSDILYLESNAHQLTISTVNGKIQIYKKLDDYEKMLPSLFVRVRKSFLVNMNYIKRMERKTLTLENGETLPISRTRAVAARNKFFEFLDDKEFG